MSTRTPENRVRSTVLGTAAEYSIPCTFLAHAGTSTSTELPENEYSVLFGVGVPGTIKGVPFPCREYLTGTRGRLSFRTRSLGRSLRKPRCFRSMSIIKAG